MEKAAGPQHERHKYDTTKHFLKGVPSSNTPSLERLKFSREAASVLQSLLKKVRGSIRTKNLSLILYPTYMLAQVQRKGLLFRQQKVSVGENTLLEGEKCVSSVQSSFQAWKSGSKAFS